MSEAILEARGIVKRYGKFTALGGVDLRIMPRTVHSVIGPNGAGKTTLFHTLTGTLPITSADPVRRSRRVARTRSQARAARHRALVPGDEPVSEPERAREPARRRAGRRSAARAESVGGAARSAHDGIVDDVLERLGLQRFADTAAGVLSHGQQRRLEVGMALAARPRAIFLDEPTSGMGIDDLDDMKALIRGLRDDYTVVLIEHNMGIVMDISDTITVMQQGRVLVEGKPDAIRGDERVRSAYLGNMITGGRA